jgi:serine/threonine-protein kinase RsbT
MNQSNYISGDPPLPSAEKNIIPIHSIADIVLARQKGRELALRNGFSSAESTLVATVISELARNIVLYAKSGAIILDRAVNSGEDGIVIMSKDEGPGIIDVERALAGGYSTSGGLGLGLSGVRRIADDFSVATEPGKGTTVIATIWKH